MTRLLKTHRSKLRSQGRGFSHTAVKHVCDVIHIGNKARLCALDGGQSKTLFKAGDLGIVHATRTYYPAQPLFANLERSLAGKDSADRRQGGSIEATVRFFVQLAFSKKRCPAGQTSRALDVGNQLAQAQKDVLIAGQPRHT